MARKPVSKYLAAIIVGGEVRPFAIVAKAAKWRGGRYWEPGVHVFQKPEQLAELGDADQVAAMVTAIEADPLAFEIKAIGVEEEKKTEG